MSAPAQLGDFRIEEEIGRGGFGIVYRARQESLDRPVAVKVLYEHKVHTAEEIARFEREARAAARLDHPSLVSVYAWGEQAGSFFIAQKLVGRGRTLADELQELKTRGEPPKGYYRHVAECMAEVAEGMQHAHERGIVHRDVKPSNILLDERGRPYLGDFGLAKIEDGLQLSRTGEMAGSPFYMSPEQADSRRGGVDHRSDIYALGVTLYELLTLQPPFGGESSHEIIRKILTEEPRPPRKVAERVPADLETICLKAMEKSRLRRYQSAAEFCHDLRCFLDGEPISASPPSAVSRILRQARRHRQAVGMLALVAALLGVAIGAEHLLSKERERGALLEQQSEVGALMGQAERAMAQENPFEDNIDKALGEGDAALARDARRRQQEWEQLVADGGDLLRGLLPDIQDTQVMQELGRSLEQQLPLLQAASAVKHYLEGQGEGSADPRLQQLEGWLASANTFLRGAEEDVPGVAGWLDTATGFLSTLSAAELGIQAPGQEPGSPEPDLSPALAPVPATGAPPPGPPTSPDGSVRPRPVLETHDLQQPPGPPALGAAPAGADTASLQRGAGSAMAWLGWLAGWR